MCSVVVEGVGAFVVCKLISGIVVSVMAGSLSTVVVTSRSIGGLLVEVFSSKITS